VIGDAANGTCDTVHRHGLAAERLRACLVLRERAGEGLLEGEVGVHPHVGSSAPRTLRPCAVSDQPHLIASGNCQLVAARDVALRDYSVVQPHQSS
jgi:hypothetical protein